MYLDMVNVSAVIISTPDGLFKVIIACCIDQRGRLSISWWLKSFFVARCRIQFLDEFLPTESEGDSLDRLPYAVLAKWSFLRLKSLQIPLLTIFSITKLRSLASKTKVSSNRSRQRKGKPSSTNLLAPFKCGGKSAKIKEFWSGMSCMESYLVFPLQSRWHRLCCGPRAQTEQESTLPLINSRSISPR